MTQTAVAPSFSSIRIFFTCVSASADTIPIDSNFSSEISLPLRPISAGSATGSV